MKKPILFSVLAVMFLLMLSLSDRKVINVSNKFLENLFPQKNGSSSVTKEQQINKVDLIKSVNFLNCRITITDESGVQLEIGKLESLGACIENPKYAVSDSGKYLIFEDRSGGLDLALEIYSVEQNKLDVFAVWGTSSLLDIKFLPNEEVVIFSGYPNIPAEQWVTVYDIPSLYRDYINLIPLTDYLNTKTPRKELKIKGVQGDYFNILIDIDHNLLNIYGGTQVAPILTGQFKLSSL